MTGQRPVLAELDPGTAVHQSQNELRCRIGQYKDGDCLPGNAMNFKGEHDHGSHVEHGQQPLPDVVGGEVAGVEDQRQPGPPDRHKQRRKFQRAGQR